VQKQRLERGAVAGEEARGEVEAFGLGEEGGKLVAGRRAKAVGPFLGRERALAGELDGKRGGGRCRGEGDLVLEWQMGEQFVEVAEGEDAAVVDDADARTEARGLLHVVRRVDDGQAGAGAGLKEVEDRVARLGIDADGGLVAEEELRLVEQRGDEIEAALHAPGKRLHGIAAAVGKLDRLEGGGDAGLEFASAETVERAEEAEILLGAEVLVERDRLGHEAEGGAVGERLAVEGDGAAVGLAQPGDEGHEGRLAGAVRTKEAEEFAAGDVDRDAIERGERAIALGHGLEREHGVGWGKGCGQRRGGAGLGAQQRGGGGAHAWPVHVGDGGAEVLDRLAAQDRADRAGSGEGGAAQVAVEETSGPGVAGAGGVDDALGPDGRDAVELGAAGDPRAVLAHLDRGNAAEGRDLAGELGVVVAALEERTGLVLVGEDDMHALAQLAEDPVTGDIDDLERGEVDAERATGGAGGGDDLIGERGVEQQVTLDVGMPRAGEIGRRDLVGVQGHGGAEVRAQRALAVGRDEREAAAVGQRGALEARAVAAGGGEVAEVGVGRGVAADLAEIGGAQAEAGGAERGVGGGSAGHHGDLAADLAHERCDVVMIHEDHAALVAGDMSAKERVVDVREQIHDGIADADEIEGSGAGRCHGEGGRGQLVTAMLVARMGSSSTSITIE